MNLEELISALESRQSIIYIQTHDVVSWLFAMDKLTEAPHYDNKEIFMARSSSCGSFEGHWHNAMPSEGCDKNVEDAALAVSMFDAAYPNVRRGERIIGVIPNASVGPHVVKNLRTFSIRCELRNRTRGSVRDERSLVFISHLPIPPELRPFCHAIIDRGVADDEARQLVLGLLGANSKDCPSRAQEWAEQLSKACVFALDRARSLAQGYSASQIIEVVGIALVEIDTKLRTLPLDKRYTYFNQRDLEEKFQKLFTERRPAYRW